MNVENHSRSALLSWLFVVLLVGLCAALGVIQYSWIGEVSRADLDRLQSSLGTGLQRVGADFDTEIRAATAAIAEDLPSRDETERERDYAIRFAKWRASDRYSGVVRRFAIAVRNDETLDLRALNFEKGVFEPAEWPDRWASLRGRLTSRAFGDFSTRAASFRGSTADETALIELPQFVRAEVIGEPGGSGGPDRPPPPFARREGGAMFHGEQGWTILELDLDYIRNYFLPELLERHLGAREAQEYHVHLVARDFPSEVLWDSDPNHGPNVHFDASIGLFDAPFERVFVAAGTPGGPPRRITGLPSNLNRGRWLLSVRHRTGSLETLVERTRRKNLAVTTAILLLMLLAAGALVQFSSRAQKLAELQMEFVAGVSHELRTPLSVIRTAAHNLGVRVISNANQVQRYGSLIEEQSEKLTDIVDRVLLFSNAKAGRVIRSREAVHVDQLLEEAKEACAKIVADAHCAVETDIEPGLPPIWGDPTALRQALLNLITNAAKYASEGRWIGVSAAAVENHKAGFVEIRVADHGPGIPPAELAHIFDPFYRGKMAVSDQIHGTGLGLSLVERIVKAHGGTIKVKTKPGAGTEFAMRIPAAPAEQIDEFADSAGRR